MKISGSILSMKEKTKDNLTLFEKSGVDMTHLDVMDGIFVSNVSLPIEEVKEIVNNFTYDVHLMVKDVKKYIDDFIKINPHNITFHYEVGNTLELINYLKKQNIKVGLAVNPNTKVEEIFPYLKDIDIALIMSVEPGIGGQEFIQSTIYKIEELYEYRKANNLSFLIEVDGGVNDKTIRLIDKADIAVVGSYITSSDYQERVENIKNILN